MLPKPKFDLTTRPSTVNTTPTPQPTLSWLQYNPNQSLNQRFVNNYPNYGQNYYNTYNNNNLNTYGNSFQPVLWHQNNYNSTNNMNVSNVWNGYQNNIRFNKNPNQTYGHYSHQNSDQNKRLRDNNHNPLRVNSNASNKSLNCDACNRWFKSEDQFNQHLSEHILCGLDECTFRAHPKVIETHQRMQHFCFRDKTLVKRFMSLETEEDIEKWKEERKRNFPTKDNIIKKQELKEKERLKAIEENNKLKQIEEKLNIETKTVNPFDKKSKKNKKLFKGKQRQKPNNTFNNNNNNNRKLTLFQKLMMSQIEEQNEEKNEEKVSEKVEPID